RLAAEGIESPGSRPIQKRENENRGLSRPRFLFDTRQLKTRQRTTRRASPLRPDGVHTHLPCRRAPFLTHEGDGSARKGTLVVLHVKEELVVHPRLKPHAVHRELELVCLPKPPGKVRFAEKAFAIQG